MGAEQPNDGSPIDGVARGLRDRLAALPPGRRHLGIFLATYLRTTEAVGAAVEQGIFEDPQWVGRWDAAFAQLYLAALDAELSSGARVPRPWRLAFDVDPGLPPLRHVLLGINAHINYDLPQALLETISDADFEDAALMARRRRDHERIDDLLGQRVAAEDNRLASATSLTLLDRLLRPLNRRGSRMFLREARRKVWHNTVELQMARLAGPAAFSARLAELEVLSAARIADLLQPGQVVLRLAAGGFGVKLPPPGA
ncbi:MAG: DUF5995 family protein [Specibacter sp.]